MSLIETPSALGNPANSKPETTSATILILDDDVSVVNSVLSVLKNNYKVRPFTSGKSLLKYLEKFSADLILMDFHMPEMTGDEVLEKIHQDPSKRNIPIIFLTGSADSEAELLAKGAMDYLLKPVKPIVLQARIRLQLELQAYRSGLEQLVAAKTEEIVLSNQRLKVREQVAMNLLARVTDLRDHDTGEHIGRTTEFTRFLIESLLDDPQPGYELSAHGAADIVNSVKLHDIGKIAIPDNILQKPGRLDPDEFEVIKRHTRCGADLLSEFISTMGEDSFLNTAYDIALYHHEKWNGQGYPDGLNGDEIPLSARIAAISDVYDALTSERTYKKSFSHAVAKAILLESSGSHFDPYLIKHFERVAPQFESVLFKSS